MRFFAAIFFLLLGSMSARAGAPYPGQKAWLFIAQDLQELESGRSYYLKKSGETNLQQLTRIFADRMGPLGFELKIEVRAKASQLRNALADPHSAAIFWIGHGSETSNSQSGGVAMQGVVLDADGVNVAPLFQSIHPNLRWVSIVSCYSQAIVEGLRGAGYYRNNPVLHIEGRTGVAISQWGLAESATNAWYYLLLLKKSYPHLIAKPAPTGFPVRARRSLNSTPSTIAIVYNNTVLGLLSEQDAEIEIMLPSLDVQRLSVQRLNVLGSLPDLEELDIVSPDRQSRWVLKKDTQGAPIGMSRQLYQKQN